MTDSILDSVKVALGILPEYTHFDDVLIMHINTVFSILTQLGVGPDNGFSITDNTTEWSSYILTNTTIEMVKSYVVKKVGLLFDPPASLSIMEAQKNLISEMEWRLNVAVDPKEDILNG